MLDSLGFPWLQTSLLRGAAWTPPSCAWSAAGPSAGSSSCSRGKPARTEPSLRRQTLVILSRSFSVLVSDPLACLEPFKGKELPGTLGGSHGDSGLQRRRICSSVVETAIHLGRVSTETWRVSCATPRSSGTGPGGSLPSPAGPCAVCPGLQSEARQGEQREDGESYSSAARRRPQARSLPPLPPPALGPASPWPVSKAVLWHGLPVSVAPPGSGSKASSFQMPLASLQRRVKGLEPLSPHFIVFPKQS